MNEIKLVTDFCKANLDLANIEATEENKNIYQVHTFISKSEFIIGVYMSKNNIAAINGTHIYYELIGSGQTIVLMHGFSLDTLAQTEADIEEAHMLGSPVDKSL